MHSHLEVNEDTVRARVGCAVVLDRAQKVVLGLAVLRWAKGGLIGLEVGEGRV